MDDQSVVPYFQGAYSYYQPQATWPVNMNTQIGDQLQVFDQNITASYNHSSHHETGMMTYPEQTSNLVLNSYPVYPAYDTGLAYPNYDSTGVFTNPYEIGALDPYQSNSVLSPSFIQTSGYEASTLAGQPPWPSSGETTLPVTSYEDGAFLYPYQSANLFLDSTLTQNSNQGAFTFTEQLPNLNNALPFVDPYHNPVLIAAEGYIGQPSVNPAHNGGMAYLESAPSTQPHDPLSGMAHINLTPGLPMEGSSHPIPFDSGLIQAPVATNKPRKQLPRCQFEGCRKTFRDAHNLRIHQYKHKPASYFCPKEDCGKKFKFPWDLPRHDRTVHQLQEVPNKKQRKTKTEKSTTKRVQKKSKQTSS